MWSLLHTLYSLWVIYWRTTWTVQRHKVDITFLYWRCTIIGSDIGLMTKTNRFLKRMLSVCWLPCQWWKHSVAKDDTTPGPLVVQRLLCHLVCTSWQLVTWTIVHICNWTSDVNVKTGVDSCFHYQLKMFGTTWFHVKCVLLPIYWIYPIMLVINNNNSKQQ